MDTRIEHELQILNAELLSSLPFLDLHGASLANAEQYLESFLNQQFCLGERVIKIMHGKGSGALKQLCEQLLSDHPLVEYQQGSSLAYEQGAVLYALLIPR